MLCNTTPTSPAMFTPKRCPDHTRNTKIALVKLPILEELVDDCFLLCDAIELRHITGVVSHRSNVEKANKTEKSAEDDV